MKFIKNEKKIDPRYFLDETAAKETIEEAGGGEHGAWVEADKKCSEKGGRNSQEYKDCMDAYDMGDNVDESIGKAAMRRDIAASQKERGFKPAGTGTPTADDWTIRTRAINSLLSDLGLAGPGQGGEFRSDADRAEALRNLADQLEDDHHDRGADLGL